MARQVARGLARRHEVTVIASGWGEAVGRAEEDGLTVFRLPTIHVSERWGVPYPVPVGRGVREALALAAEADVVHAHGALYASTILATHAARRAGAPLVLTEHVGFVQYQNALLNRLQRCAWATIGNWTVRSSRAVAVYNWRVAHWLRTRYARLDPAYIGNGVDLAQFRPRATSERSQARAALGLPQGRTLVLFVGREAAKKNLEALLAIPREHFSLVVCGAQRAQLPSDVVDLGIVRHEDMWKVYASADVMVLPSTGEGFPLAMQESVAAGLPLVLLWDEGYEQWLSRDVVVACDSLPELGTRLQGLVESSGDRARLAQAGREWAIAHWSWDATVAGYEALYERARANACFDRSKPEPGRARIA